MIHIISVVKRENIIFLFREILLDNEERLNKNTPLFDYKGFFLVVLTSISCNATQFSIMEKIFERSWYLYSLNVNVITDTSTIYSHEAKMHTYFPYSPNKCDALEPILINQYVSGHFMIENQIVMFPDKLYNMHGCPVYLATFHFPPFIYLSLSNDAMNPHDLTGIEGLMLKLMAKRLNFKIVVRVPADNMKWGNRLPNKTMTGAMKMIIEGDANITAGGWGLLKERMEWMDSVISIQSFLGFAIPPGEPFSSFEKLFLPLSTETWCLIAATFVVGYIFIVFLKFVKPSTRSFIVGQRNDYPFFNMFSLFLGGSNNSRLSRNFSRFIFILWGFGSLIIRSLYQGGMFGFLQLQLNKTNPDTVDGIIERQFKLYTLTNAVNYLEQIPQLRKLAVPFTPGEMDLYYEKIRDPRTHGVLMDSSIHIGYINMKNYSRGILMTNRDQFVSLSMPIYLRKSSYLTINVNREALLYSAAGLIDCWLNMFTAGGRYTKKISATEPTQMNVDQISGCIFLCLILYGFAFVVLLLELMAKWSSRVERIIEFFT